jgi:hypothetical protein
MTIRYSFLKFIRDLEVKLPWGYRVENNRFEVIVMKGDEFVYNIYRDEVKEDFFGNLNLVLAIIDIRGN